MYVPSSSLELGLSHPLSRHRVCPYPRNQRGGGHTRLRVRVWGSPNSDDWRKSLALCLFCGYDIQRDPKVNFECFPKKDQLCKNILEISVQKWCGKALFETFLFRDLKVAYVCFQLASTFKYKEPSHEIFFKFSIQRNIHFIDEFADGFKTSFFNDWMCNITCYFLGSIKLLARVL